MIDLWYSVDEELSDGGVDEVHLVTRDGGEVLVGGWQSVGQSATTSASVL